MQETERPKNLIWMTCGHERRGENAAGVGAEQREIKGRKKWTTVIA